MKNSTVLESCIKNYALPIWKDKIKEYYPKDKAKKYIEKLNNGISFCPDATYMTIEDNLSYLDLISSGKKNRAKNELIEKFSENAPNYSDTFSSYEMLLHSNYGLEFLPIFKNYFSPHSEAKDLINYLNKFENNYQAKNDDSFSDFNKKA